MSKKVALVTGGATGIGAAVCTELANQDIRVAVCDTNHTDGKALAKKIDGVFITCDVTKLVSVQEAVRVCRQKLGVPDYVHLNAGIMTVPTGHSFLAIENVTEAQYQKIVGVNLNGIFHGVKTLLPLMRDKGGAVTITSSTAGLSVVPVDPMYTATKYALVGFGRAVAAANEGSNIRINVICPGVTDTQIVPNEYRAPEFKVMSVKIIATEIADLLFYGANGEIRVKNSADTPAFAIALPDLN
jgi:NAD(P)-dependent dehydrogenase (short-subunit alcohol dehydrogenase family)